MQRTKKLRAEKPELGDRLDLAAELEWAKGDVAELMKQRKGDKREIGNTERRADAAKRQVIELEAKVRELEGARCAREGESALAGRKEAELEELRANNASLARVRGELEGELTALQRRSSEEREMLQQQQGLAHYRR